MNEVHVAELTGDEILEGNGATARNAPSRLRWPSCFRGSRSRSPIRQTS